jgi:lipopolysaccharide transport system permease protein
MAMISDAQTDSIRKRRPGRNDALPVLELTADMSHATRARMAAADIREGLRMFRLSLVLGWLDIKLRYRGSLLGPFWLTLSTAIMVGSLGLLYSTLFKMELRDYLPYLALSLVLWNFLGSLVAEGCTSFTDSESLIRSLRMPYLLHALRVAVRNVIVLGHNIVVIAGVFAIFAVTPKLSALLVLPGLALWAIDALAVIVLLGAFCARFRDIPPIVASIMQIAFFVTPIVWRPEQLGAKGWWLDFNPFYPLLEVVRAPLLGMTSVHHIWFAACVYSAALCLVSWLLFARVRGRLAFWM